jgi:4,5-DOPA dioxygenase extradiol
LIQDIFPDKRYQVIQRGLDHGTWTVLRHVFPLANIPVFALSLDSRDSYQDAMELGRRLQELRIKGVLIVANGNIVHNLSDITWSGPKNFAHEYAKAFDTAFMDAWNSQDVEKLCSPHSLV